MLYENHYPERLAAEIEAAARRRVRPVRLWERGAEQAMASGEIKWVVTEAGELLVMPLLAGGEEIMHPVMVAGAPVRAAGRARLVGQGRTYQVLSFNNKSLHYLPDPECLAVGIEAFARAGVPVPDEAIEHYAFKFTPGQAPQGE